MNERIICLDIGDARIGVAVSDMTRLIATPIDTIYRVGWGPDTKKVVAICAKDARVTYTYELTNRIIDYAKKAECDYCVDVFYRYGTDGNAAVRAGNNLRAAAFGMAVYCSHGRERTHIDGMVGTTQLMLAYAMDI